MSQQVITPELCAWITEQSNAGHPSDSILAAMLGSGVCQHNVVYGRPLETIY